VVALGGEFNRRFELMAHGHRIIGPSGHRAIWAIGLASP
jgi:hypothetical protein